MGEGANPELLKVNSLFENMKIVLSKEVINKRDDDKKEEDRTSKQIPSPPHTSDMTSNSIINMKTSMIAVYTLEPEK